MCPFQKMPLRNFLFIAPPPPLLDEIYAPGLDKSIIVQLYNLIRNL